MIQPGASLLFSVSCRALKVGGGLLIVLVCSINIYFVVIYVAALHSVWLYVLAAFLSVAYLSFVGYLVGNTFCCISTLEVNELKTFFSTFN